MGGMEGDAIDLSGHDFALWEKRVDALMALCTSRGRFTVDGLRRAIEQMGPDAFDKMTYYERWISAVTQNLLETGAFTVDELNAKMREVAARGDTYGECSLEGAP